MSSADGSGRELSEYEKLREANIARNRAIMLSLGLGDTDVRLHKASSRGEPKKKRQREAPREGSRRSQRLAGQAADDASGRAAEDAREDAHEDENASHLVWAGKQAGSSIVGTASYEHTLMRVRSMSEAALWTRMKRIEQAKGRHAVTKMRRLRRPTRDSVPTLSPQVSSPESVFSKSTTTSPGPAPTRLPVSLLSSAIPAAMMVVRPPADGPES
mmetsp:Transcript_17402/g.54349  ORF Transcript_17402/g.54349 Transcript_17402/m.54349 type:complete len:215 (+) Transcript_17402:80-724(+)